MSCILYKLVDGKVVSERVPARRVNELLKSGYCGCPDKLKLTDEIDTNNSGKLSDTEIKEAAKKAGIKVGRKSIKTLKEELGL